MKRFILFVIGVTAMLAIGSLAAKDGLYFPAEKLEPEQFPALKAQLEADLNEGGRLDGMRRHDRKAILEKLIRIENILSGKTSLEEVHESDRVALFNHQEEINALLNAKKSRRESCIKLAALGSHISEVLCADAAEREANRLASREKMRSLRSSTRMDETQ